MADDDAEGPKGLSRLEQGLLGTVAGGLAELVMPGVRLLAGGATFVGTAIADRIRNPEKSYFDTFVDSSYQAASVVAGGYGVAYLR